MKTSDKTPSASTSPAHSGSEAGRVENILTPLAINHISVDCVVFGWDGERLKVLLVSRRSEGEEFSDLKLPGSLIYQDENLDEAAERVLRQLTGLQNAGLTQFKAYGSKDRTRNPEDVVWLERAQKAHVERIVTIAYIALVKIDRATLSSLKGHDAVWVEADKTGRLAFDHNLILREAIRQMQSMVTADPALIFSLLPKKFTLAQLRRLFEVIYGKSLDIRNFHKKVMAMAYVVPLDEFQKGVAHRAARFYRFDRKIFNRQRR